jgi:hypothetical protein
VLSPTAQALGAATNFAEIGGSSLPDPIFFNNRVALNLLVLPQDSDHDGMPDDWELAHGLNPTNAVDAALDSDCDGAPNLQEYLAGTDPIRFDDLRLLSPRFDSQGRFECIVHAQSGRTYVLETSSDLAHWSPLSTFVLRAQNQQIQMPSNSNTLPSFFRLRGDTNPVLPLLELINRPTLTTNPPLLKIIAPPGRNYSLHASTDLVQWFEITNYYGVTCVTWITDQAPASNGSRFYRVIAH